MSLSYIIYLANYSDGVLYVLALLLLVALAVIIDRFWSLRSTIVHGQSIIRATAGFSVLGERELAALRASAGKMPEAALFSSAAGHIGTAGAEAIASRLDETIMLIAPALDRRLWILDTVTTLAPLLGLFGTIIGMFHAFNVLAQPGHAPTEITGGVADALVATAFGLLIAMLGLAGFNALSNQVRLVVHQLDTLKTMIVNRIGNTPDLAVRPAAMGHGAASFATV